MHYETKQLERTLDEVSKKQKPFYKDLKDTLEDVGITRRQLMYWRKEDLFESELGPSARYFTARDMEQLRLLKMLIEELGFPVKTVKRLRENSPYSWHLDPDCPTYSLPYISLNAKALVPLHEVFYDPVREAFRGRHEKTLEGWLLLLTAVCFRLMKSSGQGPRVYESRRDELISAVRRMDRAVRAEAGPDQFNSAERKPDLYPRLSDDPQPFDLPADEIFQLEVEYWDTIKVLGEDLGYS